MAILNMRAKDLNAVNAPALTKLLNRCAQGFEGLDTRLKGFLDLKSLRDKQNPYLDENRCRDFTLAYGDLEKLLEHNKHILSGVVYAGGHAAKLGRTLYDEFNDVAVDTLVAFETLRMSQRLKADLYEAYALSEDASLLAQYATAKTGRFVTSDEILDKVMGAKIVGNTPRQLEKTPAAARMYSRMIAR